ncbi:thiol:disulfide interchange protein DsbD [Vibrio zhanjiangensis]|uniref:Thiol:disulfide interchange protein DsbD n=1 Tax=Vibrio zhanjiangensis TaxID=1046128 RepID=A0ABQ6F4E9_9VIBR|nr:protein-disulfide reductase DsbD [Vibrio zhanjiangensis]GLT20106.1 thiol:disulfide interchange protein DsbD [Vibrio zhanjiangensis]
MRAILSLVLLSLTAFSAPSLALFEPSKTTASFGNQSNTFVPVDEAFPFNAFQQGNRVFVDWQVKKGYYLYQHMLSIEGENVSLDKLVMENGIPHQDEFFGEVHIYPEPLFVEVPLLNYQDGAKLTIRYQGCAEAGFCYPPETRVVNISPFESQGNTSSSESQVSATQVKNTTTESSQVSQESNLATSLSDNWWTPLLFLILGMGLALTPCVLPMYPILTSIVLGSGKLSHSRALGLAFIYVQGMALTYTLLGLVVASAGLQFQAAMQHPYVLIGLSIMFVALALSMFGVYTIQLPSKVQTWLSNISNQQQGGSSLGVFAMGAISGLVCSPCTTAPLSGALLYVAQSGDLVTGGVALYALALGMGIPLMLVAVFGNKLLPKAGSWMDKVKTLFGFILLAAPIFLLERILPEIWATALWSMLGLAAFSWLYHVKNSLPLGTWKQSAIGIIAILGLFASVQPVLNHWFGNHIEQSQPSIQFTRITTVKELNQQLTQAKLAGKPVMLDFYADWCVACKEFEKYTFHQPDVENRLKNFVLLQADVTKSQPQDIELLKEMNVLGLPTIEFWDANGQHIPSARITGFMQAEPFLQHINAHNL